MTSAGVAEDFGAEWSGIPDPPKPTGVGWPELRSAQQCDGQNPMTGRSCLKGHHRGFHRDDSGAEWLDD